MGISIEERQALGTADGNPRDDGLVIGTRGLRKVYTNFWKVPKVTAVHGLDMEVRRGELFGFLGPNGAGKTTTTKLLLGLLKPTAGTAHVLGHPAGSVAANRRLGYLPEETYLYKFLNAHETLDFFGKMFALPRRLRRSRVEEVLELVGLAKVLRGDPKRPLREYSKGMARRIGLAQALMNDPELLVLDEPTSGLDPTGRRDMKDLLVHLKAMGKTIFLCSHLLAEVQEVCDRILIMNRGKKMVEGPLAQLRGRPDRARIDVRRLDEPTRKKVLELLRAENVEVLHVGPVEKTLEEIFLEAIGRPTQTDDD